MSGFKHLPGFVYLLVCLIIIMTSAASPLYAGEKPEIFVQMGHTSSINAIEMSPDDKFILSGSDDRSIKLWETDTGRLIRTFKDNDQIKFVSFLEGGKTFVSASNNGNICIWDIQTGDKIKEFSLAETSFASLRSNVFFDGTTLQAIIGLKLSAANISTGKIIKSAEARKSSEVSGYFGGFGFGFRNVLSADGRRMFSSVRENSSESFLDTKSKKLMLWEISSGKIIYTFTGHEALIDVMSLSYDDKLALSGSRDKTVRLWDLRRGRSIATFAGHKESIETVAFSPDQQYFLSGSRDKTMKLWDIREKKEIRTFAHDSEVTFVRFSTDGLFALSGDYKGAIRVWDLQTGKMAKVLKSDAANPTAMASSPDGNQMLTAYDNGHLRLWDAASGKLLKTIQAHNGGVSSVNFTPDGKYALSACYTEKNLKLWDLNEGKLHKTLSGHSENIYKTVISPDGLYALSSGYNRNVLMWDLKSGVKKKTFEFQGDIKSIGFAPDSRHLFIAHSRKESGDLVKVLTLEGQEVKYYDDVYLGNYSKDGRYFIASRFKEPTDKEQQLFVPEVKQKRPIYRKEDYYKTSLVDIGDGNVLGRFGQSGSFVHVSASPNSGNILTKNYYDHEVRLWDAQSGKEVRRFPVKFGLLSPDGRKVIGPAGKTLQAFDTDTGRSLPAFNGTTAGSISSFALSARGGYAATGDTAGNVDFWDVSSGKIIKTIKAETGGETIIAVVFSPDNKYAASLARFGSAKIWDLGKGTRVSEFKIDYIPVYYDEFEAGDYIDYGNGLMVFSPDSRNLASGSKLWDASSGKIVREFQTPFGPGPWVAFSPDGSHLLSRNMLWEISTGQRVKTFENLKDPKSVYSPDGKFIYAADSEGYFFIAETSTGKIIRKFNNFVNSRSFGVSLDKKTLIAAENNYNELTLWDLPAGRKRTTIEGNDSISDILPSPDAGKAVLKSWVSARQFNLVTGKELAQFISFTDDEWIVITPEGYYSASANADKYLNVRVGSSVYGIENYREAFFRPDLVKLALSGGSLKDYRTLADVKQPPKVDIVRTQTTSSAEEFKLTLRLEEQGGGIGDVRLFLNGSAVMLDSGRSLKVAQKDEKGAAYRSYTLRLSPGNNTIRAVAFNADNSMQSNDATHLVNASFTPAGKPTLHALVIGIQEFKNPKLSLKHTVADANLFAETLRKGATGLFEQVRITTLTARDGTTRDIIIAALQKFKAVSPDDLFILYIASHGTVDEGEYFLITSNVGALSTQRLKNDAISQTQLKELVANIPSTKKLIVIDTCNAGQLGQAMQTALLTRGMSEDTAMKVLSRAVGSTILSASTSVQEALEGYQGHGLFTWAVTQGMQGKADKGKTGFVKTTDLAGYVEDEVPNLAERIFKRAQFPTVSISGQGFPIGKTR